MKRRILASLLTLVMMLSLLPTAALANGETNDSPSPSQPSTKYDWNDYGGYYDSATMLPIRRRLKISILKYIKQQVKLQRSVSLRRLLRMN